jgi:uncharacterized protein YjiS (DUF1127 family)
MSDRLALAHAFEDAGIPRDKAESVATAVARFVEGSAATKADVDRAEAALKTDIAVLRSDIGLLRSDIARIADRTLIRLSGVMVVLLGVLFAALRWHS